MLRCAETVQPYIHPCSHAVHRVSTSCHRPQSIIKVARASTRHMQDMTPSPPSVRELCTVWGWVDWIKSIARFSLTRFSHPFIPFSFFLFCFATENNTRAFGSLNSLNAPCANRGTDRESVRVHKGVRRMPGGFWEHVPRMGRGRGAWDGDSHGRAQRFLGRPWLHGCIWLGRFKRWLTTTRAVNRKPGLPAGACMSQTSHKTRTSAGTCAASGVRRRNMFERHV